MTKYVMHRKDFRVLIANAAFEGNPNYVEVSDADAKAVMAGGKPGTRVLREMLLNEREEELKGLIAGQNGESPAELPAADPQAPTVLPAALAVPEGEAPAASAPAETDIANMKVKDLLLIANAHDIKFEAGTTKAQMIETLTKVLGAETGEA
jgi:hypothetical protein